MIEGLCKKRDYIRDLSYLHFFPYFGSLVPLSSLSSISDSLEDILLRPSLKIIGFFSPVSSLK